MKYDKIALAFLEDLFNTHPDTDVFHLTSDGQAFALGHHADAHGQRLKDKRVIPVTRADVFDGGDDELNFSNGLGGETPEAPADQGGETPKAPADQGGDTPEALADQGGETPEAPADQETNTKKGGK